MADDSTHTRRTVLRALAAVFTTAAAACTKPRRGAASRTTATPGTQAAASAPTSGASTTSPGTRTIASARSAATPTKTAAKPAAASAGAASGPAVFVANGSRRRAEIALTFHGSGDPSLAKALLRLAEQGGAQLTIFAVGQWLVQAPEMAARITGGGHELANHTWSHPSLGRLGADQVRLEIVRCRDELAARTGAPGTYFRPSAMRTPTDRVLSEAGAAGYRTVVGFDIDTLDFRDPGPAAIRRLAATARAGSIVSLHLGHPGTVKALAGILTDLRRRGLSPVTVGALLRK